MNVAVQAAPLRQWQRFSPAERIMRSVFYLIALIAIVWSLRSIEIIPEFLYDAPQQTADLLFAWRAVASVKSNAIVLARGGATIGIGAGQMSRVDAAFLAVHKATGAGHQVAGSVLGSDAFFPFRDGIDQAAAAGVRAIIQPGGSARDDEVIAAANEHGMAMVFTGQRLFRH